MIGLRFASLCIPAVAFLAVAACSSNDDSSTTSPTTTSLSGKWTGTVGQTGDAHPATLVWTAAQSGSTLSGPLTATFLNGTQTVTVSGTLSGTISSNAIALTLNFPAGAFTSAGGPATCAMSGTSNATLASTAINGTMTITWGAACVGTVAEKATETDQVVLTRQ